MSKAPDKTIKLYKNTIIIDFYADKHIYIERLTGDRPISVTGATSVIDKSRPLIFWAIGLMKDFLLEVSSNGETIGDNHILEASKQHTIRKDQAASKGSAVHDWIEEYINTKLKKSKDPEMPKDAQVLNGVIAFLKWADEHKVKFIATEKIVYSRKSKYVGILDALVMVDKKLTLIDFKTSSGIYPEFFLQIAGYKAAYEEETGKEIKQCYIAHFDKNTAEFDITELKDYGKHLKAFLAALTIKKWQKDQR